MCKLCAFWMCMGMLNYVSITNFLCFQCKGTLCANSVHVACWVKGWAINKLWTFSIWMSCHQIRRLVVFRGVYMYICVCVCVSVCFLCNCLCLCLCICICICIYDVNVYVYVYVYVYVSIYIYIYMCMFVCMSVYIYIYIPI